MNTLSIVIPIHNQVDMAKAVYQQLVKTFKTYTPEVVLIDNGSTVPLSQSDFPDAVIHRNEKSIGVYPTFEQGFKVAKGSIIAFFHSDLTVWEDDWALRVIHHFDMNDRVGMIGFIGSNEIDPSGGRGLGTTSNFMGLGLINEHGKQWLGSAGYIHGKQSGGYSNAAVVDGCAMIISRHAWNVIGVVDGFPPHHFYDRLISTQLLRHHFLIAVLGIECDHFSGQTVNQEKGYQKMAWEWLVKNNIAHFALTDFDENHNYDADIYSLAEQQWLKEYRERGYVPYRVL